MHQVDNRDNYHGFLKNGSIGECLPQEISGTCVDTQLRGIEHFALSVVTGNNPALALVPGSSASNKTCGGKKQTKL